MTIENYLWLLAATSLSTYSLLNMVRYSSKIEIDNIILYIVWSILFIINFRNMIKNILNIIVDI